MLAKFLKTCYAISRFYVTAVLISGDSDFATPIDRIKKVAKRIIVMSTRGHISKELLARAKFLDLRKIKAEISQK